MCLAIWRPVLAGRTSKITDRTIDIAFTRHPDGYGLVTRADGALRVERFAPNERKAYRKALRRVDAAGVEYAAHWRFATSGPKDRDHSHPYVYSDPAGFDVAILHNGIINIAHDPRRTSDTAAFVEQVLTTMPSRWWEQPAMRFLVSEAIGWSKLIVFPAVGETVVINEADGEWDRGIWYSSNHRPAFQPVKPSGPKGGVYAVTAPQTRGASEAYKGLTGRNAPTPPPAQVQRSARVPTVTSEEAYLPDRPAGRAEYPYLRHAGHSLTALVPMDMTRDGDYEGGARCDSCGTLGTVYVIDGSTYVDMAHRELANLAIEERVFADALPF